jgi:hypothetical protein
MKYNLVSQDNITAAWEQKYNLVEGFTGMTPGLLKYVSCGKYRRTLL